MTSSRLPLVILVCRKGTESRRRGHRIPDASSKDFGRY
jgi:hypothetical protein